MKKENTTNLELHKKLKAMNLKAPKLRKVILFYSEMLGLENDPTAFNLLFYGVQSNRHIEAILKLYKIVRFDSDNEENQKRECSNA